MQDYLEHIEEKDQICTMELETCTLHTNATHRNGILVYRSLLNTLKLNLTSRRFDCDNFKKLEQLHKKHYQSKMCTRGEGMT